MTHESSGIGVETLAYCKITKTTLQLSRQDNNSIQGLYKPGNMFHSFVGAVIDLTFKQCLARKILFWLLF